VSTIIELSAQKISTDDLYEYNTQVNRPNGTWNNELGYGLIDARAAVLIAQQTACLDNITITAPVGSGDSVSIVASNVITSYSDLEANSNSSYASGSKIVLKANTSGESFHAKSGAVFNAKIKVCKPRIINAIIPLDRINTFDPIDRRQLDVTANDAKNDLIKLYPNPSSGLVSLVSNKLITNYSISNQLGRVLEHKRLDNDTFEKQLDISNYPVGIYFVKITLNTKETFLLFAYVSSTARTVQRLKIRRLKTCLKQPLKNR